MKKINFIRVNSFSAYWRLKKQTRWNDYRQRWDHNNSVQLSGGGKASLCTIFRECSGKDRQFGASCSQFILPVSLHHTYLEAECCQGEDLSPGNLSVGWRLIQMSGINIRRGTTQPFPPPPSCLLPWQKPMWIINNLRRRVQNFHSDLGQQTVWAVGGSNIWASIKSRFSRWSSRISTK